MTPRPVVLTLCSSLACWLIACTAHVEKPPQVTAEVVKPAPSVPPEPPPASPEPTRIEPIEPPTAPSPTVAPVLPADRFRLAVAKLIEGVTPSATTGKTAWADLEAGRLVEAQRGFAVVALAEPAIWKHPFNLACAAARANDERMTRVGLVEAIRRGGARVVDKARSDGDLATMRSAAWFEPVLRGEDPGETVAPTPDPPAVAPTEPVPAEPATPSTDPPAVAPTVPLPAEPAAPREPTVPAPRRPAKLPGAATAIRTALAAADLAALKTSLAELHGVAVVVRKSLELPTAAGGREGFAVYEFSRFKACLTRADKKTCRRELGANANGGLSVAACTEQWLVRVSLGERLELGERTALQPACKLTHVRTLEAIDLDGDGDQEVLVDVVGRAETETQREGSELEVGRIVRVLRRDGSVQLEMRIGWSATTEHGRQVTAQRFYLTDTDADGHPDMVLQRQESRSDDELDDELWPEDALDSDGKPQPVITAIKRYDPVTDSWPGVVVTWQ